MYYGSSGITADSCRTSDSLLAFHAAKNKIDGERLVGADGPAVNASLTRLQAEIDSLSKVSGELCSRLEYVSTPSNTGVDGQIGQSAQPVELKSPIAAKVDELAQRVRVIHGRLGQALGALEV